MSDIHMHLRVKSSKKHKFFVGDLNDCPYCFPTKELRLAQKMREHLKENYGQTVYEKQFRAQWSDMSASQMKRALKYLGLQVYACNSCHAMISNWTGHKEPCPHA